MYLRCISDTNDARVPRLIHLTPLVNRHRVGAYERVIMRVGRHPLNEIQLDSVEMPLLLSRFHAYLFHERDRLSVMDQDTTNGTYVRTPLPAPRARGPSERRRARRQVNGTMLPSGEERELMVNDIVSFGGPTHVRARAHRPRDPGERGAETARRRAAGYARRRDEDQPVPLPLRVIHGFAGDSPPTG